MFVSMLEQRHFYTSPFYSFDIRGDIVGDEFSQNASPVMVVMFAMTSD